MITLKKYVFVRAILCSLLCSCILSASNATYQSAPPTWLTSDLFKANNEAVINTLTGNDKTPRYTFNFKAPAFPSVPSLAYGIKGYQGNDFMGQEYFEIRRQNLTASLFSVSVQIFGVTNLWILNVAYIAINPQFPHHCNTFDNVPLNYSSGPFTDIALQASYPTQHIQTINYTQQASDRSIKTFQTPLNSNRILLMIASLFINAKFADSAGKYPIKLKISYEILDTSIYTLKLTISSYVKITQLHFSQIVFNSDDVQSSKKYFIVFDIWQTPTAGGFYAVPSQFNDNFIMCLMDFQTVDGKCGIQYIWEYQTQNGVDGVLMKPSVITYGDCGENLTRSVVFFLKTWKCQPPYVYFNLTSNLCQNFCGDYTFQNTTYNNCDDCNYACQKCNSSSPLGCLACNQQKDNRIFVNSSCICKDGYYDDGGSSACQACTGKVSNCAKCFYNSSYNSNDSAKGSLQYGCSQCLTNFFNNASICQSFKVCLDTNNQYINTTVNLCQKCQLLNCIKCSSLTQCLTCNNSINYFINSTTKLCQICKLKGCIKCSTLSKCITCNQSLGYFLDTVIGTCQDCTPGCTNCKSSTAQCLSCKSPLSLVNNSCVCLSGTFNDLVSRSCIKCNSLCLNCWGPSLFECTECNKNWNRVLVGGRCICDPKNYMESNDSTIKSCQKIMITVCKQGYMYVNVSNKCEEICGDGKAYQAQCDDGNNKNDDGCSSECKIEKDFECVKDVNLKSICKYKGNINIDSVDNKKVKGQNTIIIEVELSPKNLDVYSKVDWKKQLTVTGANITFTNVQYKNGKLYATATYNENIGDKNLSVNLMNTTDSQLTGVSLTGSNFNIAQQSGTSIKFYSPSIYAQAQVAQKFIQGVVITGYIGFGINFALKNSLPILFMISAMQVAFVGLATMPNWNPICSTLINLKSIMGSNSQDVQNVRVLFQASLAQKQMGFSSSFLKNVNTMLIIQYSLALVSLFIYLISTKNIAFKVPFKIIQRQLLIIVIFNSNNILFSLSLINTGSITQLAVGVISVIFIIGQLIHFLVYYKTYYGIKNTFDIHKVHFKTFVIGLMVGRVICLAITAVFKDSTEKSSIGVFIIQCLLCILLTFIRPFASTLANIAFLISEYSVAVFVGCSFALSISPNTFSGESSESLLAWIQVGSICCICLFMMITIVKMFHTDWIVSRKQAAKVQALSNDDSPKKEKSKESILIQQVDVGSFQEVYEVKTKYRRRK